MANIKITQLPNIGNGLAANTVLPVVNTAGTATTDKVSVGNIANFILTQAGNTLPPAFVANIAYSVANAAQPNITSVGTLNIDTLHISGGTNGYVLQTDGAGNLTWTAQTGGGGGNASPAGANSQVQFNDAGEFGGNSGFTFDKTSGLLSTPLVSTTELFDITGVTINNGDLAHGVTSAVVIPANGNSVTPMQVTNTYGNVAVTTGTNSDALKTWVFDKNANLTLPAGGNIYYANGAVYGSVYGNSNVASFLAAFGSNTLTTTGNIRVGAVTVQQDIHGNGDLRLHAAVDGNTTIDMNNTGNIDLMANVGNVNLNTANNKAWSFESSGNLAIPGNIIVNGKQGFWAYNNSALTVTANVQNDYNGVSMEDNADTYMYAKANVVLETSSGFTNYDWTFDDTGNLTLPNNGRIGPYGMGWPSFTSPGPITVASLSSDPDHLNETTGSINLISNDFESYATISAGNIAIATYTWTFDASGNLTLPENGNIYYSNGEMYGGSSSTGNITFDDINIIGTGNINLQPDPSQSGSILDIYLTTGPDVHIATNAENLILGRDNTANVTVGANNTVSVQSYRTDTQSGINENSANDNVIWISVADYPTIDQVTNNWLVNIDGTNYTISSVQPDTPFAGFYSITVNADISIGYRVSVYFFNNVASVWNLDQYGAINLPYPGTLRGINVNSVATGFAQLQWVDNGNINIADPNNSTGPKNWVYVDSDGVTLETNINETLGNTSYTWRYNQDGTVTFPYLASSSRTGSGESLLFQKSYNQKIISTANGTADVNTVERLVISGGDSYFDGNSYIGEGGDLYLWAGQGENGGDIKVDAGTARGAGQEGGTIKVRGGYSYSGPGGFIEMFAGSSGGGDGGQINIAAGGGTSAGGNVTINAGQGNDAGGEVQISAGAGSTTSGNVNITGGFTNTFTTNKGGNVNIAGGTASFGDGGGGPGGDVNIQGGASYDNVGGNVYISGGSSTVSTRGNVYLQDQTFLPVKSTGEGTGESLTVNGARTNVGGLDKPVPYAYTLPGDSVPFTIAYQASSQSVMSAKITFVVQSNGAAFNWEQFDVSLVKIDSANAMTTVSNRIRSNDAIDWTLVEGEVVGGLLTVYLTQPTGQTGGFVNYQATEFNLMVD